MKKKIAAFLRRVASKLSPGAPLEVNTRLLYSIQYGEIQRVQARAQRYADLFKRHPYPEQIKEDTKREIADRIARDLLAEGYISFAELEQPGLGLWELRGEVLVVNNAKHLEP